jgi:general stress protein YciG
MNAGENERIAAEANGGQAESTTTPAPEVEAPASEPEAPTAEGTPAPRRRRGFAAMDRDKVREIARLGGKAAHQAGTAHEFTSEEARAAGRNGGLATHAKRRARSTDAAAKG